MKKHRQRGIDIIKPAQIKFAEEYVKNGGAIEAAAESAGYAKKYGSELIRMPQVKEEIKRMTEQLQVQSGYTIKAAFEQTQRLLLQSERMGQMMAAARFAELSMRLHGHLIDRVQVATVNMHQALEDSKSASNPHLNDALMTFLADWKPAIEIKPEEGDIFDDD
jgi:Terminase small subunit